MSPNLQSEMIFRGEIIYLGVKLHNQGQASRPMAQALFCIHELNSVLLQYTILLKICVGPSGAATRGL